MTEHNLFCYPYASLTNAQLPLLKVAALYFEQFVLARFGQRELDKHRFSRQRAQPLSDLVTGKR